jgi:hypothetical protein
MLYCTILYYAIPDDSLPYCTVLYFAMLCYAILYYNILYYTMLYYVILYYTTLYYIILCYNILYYTNYTVLYYTILFNTFIGMLHSIILVILHALTFGVYSLYSSFSLLTFYVLPSLVLCSVFISLILSNSCVNFANAL